MAVPNKDVAIDISADLGNNLLKSHSDLTSSDTLLLSQGDKVPVDIRFYEGVGRTYNITDVKADNITLMGRWSHSNAPALNQITLTRSEFTISITEEGGLEGTLDSGVGIGTGFQAANDYPLTQNGVNKGAILTVQTVNAAGGILTSAVTSPGSGYNAIDTITIENPLGIDPVEPNSSPATLSSDSHTIIEDQNALFGLDLNIGQTDSGVIASSGISTEVVTENPEFFTDSESYDNIFNVQDAYNRIDPEVDNFFQYLDVTSPSNATTTFTEDIGAVFSFVSPDSSSPYTGNGLQDITSDIAIRPHIAATIVNYSGDKLTLDLGDCFVKYTNSSQSPTAGYLAVCFTSQSNTTPQIAVARRITNTIKKRVVIDILPFLQDTYGAPHPSVLNPVDINLVWCPFVECELYIEKLKLIRHSSISTYSSQSSILKNQDFSTADYYAWRIERDGSYDDSMSYGQKKISQFTSSGTGVHVIEGTIGLGTPYESPLLIEIKDNDLLIKQVRIDVSSTVSSTDTTNGITVDYLDGSNTLTDGSNDYTDSVVPHGDEPDYTNRWYWDDINIVAKHSGQNPRLVDVRIYFNAVSQNIKVQLYGMENVDLFNISGNVNDTDHATVSLYYKELFVRRESYTHKWHLLPNDITGEIDHSSVNHKWYDWNDLTNTSIQEHIFVDERQVHLLKDWHAKNISALANDDPFIGTNQIQPELTRSGLRISQYLNYPIKANNTIGLNMKGDGFLGKVQFFGESGNVVHTNKPNSSLGLRGYHDFVYDPLEAGSEILLVPSGDIHRVDLVLDKSGSTSDYIESVDLIVYNTAFNKPACAHTVLDSTYDNKHYEIAGATEPRNNSLIISGINNNIAYTLAPEDKSQIELTAAGIRDVYWLCQELGSKHPDGFSGVANKTYNIYLDANYSGISSDLTSDNNNISIYIRNSLHGWLKVHETFFKAGGQDINLVSPIDFDAIAYAFDSDIQANINSIAIQNSMHASFVEVVNGGIRFFTGGVSPTEHADFTISNLNFNYGQDFQLNWFYDLQQQNIKVWIDDNLIKTVSLPGGYPENAWSSNSELDFLKLGTHKPYESNQVFNGTVNSLLRHWSGTLASELVTYNNDVTGVEIGAVAQTSFLATMDFNTSEIHSYFDLGNETGVINCDFQVSDASHSYSLARFSVTLVRDIDYDLSTATPYIIT